MCPSIENIDFAGYIVSLCHKEESTVIRLLTVGAFSNEEITNPIFVLKILPAISSDDSLSSLYEIMENEDEIASLEIDNNNILLWVYDYEDSIKISYSDIEYTYEPLGPVEIKMLISNNNKESDEQEKEIMLLNKKVNSINRFIAETENRINIKSENHPSGTTANKIYTSQSNLLSRLKHILND